MRVARLDRMTANWGWRSNSKFHANRCVNRKPVGSCSWRQCDPRTYIERAFRAFGLMFALYYSRPHLHNDYVCWLVAKAVHALNVCFRRGDCVG